MSTFAPDYGVVPPITISPDGHAPSLRSAAEPATAIDYDTYFRIHRDTDPVRWARAASTVAALVTDDLTTTSLDVGLQRDMLLGVSRLLNHATALVDETGPAESVRPAEVATDSRIPDQYRLAAQRWKVGHHLFHFLLALMNRVGSDSVTAWHRREFEAAAEHVDGLTQLFDSCTAAMHYAAEFEASVYDLVIRPSMSPPWMPEGFSGVFNEEHRILAGILSDLKSKAKEPGTTDRLRVSLNKLWRSQSRNRREHRAICEKFVPGGDSLLKEHFRRQEEQT